MAEQSGAQKFESIGSGIGGIGGVIPGISETLFGASGSSEIARLLTKSGTVTEQLDIDEAGVQKILQDILGSEQGLAAIFSGEQASGLFGSTVAAQASGDLLAKLAGEIAKLTAKKVTTTDLKEEDVSTSETEKPGLLQRGGEWIMDEIFGQPKEGDKKNFLELIGLG